MSPIGHSRTLPSALDLPAQQDAAGAFEYYFLSRRERPQGMDYFDELIGLQAGNRLAELIAAQEAGHKIIGVYCAYAPEELALAAGAIPVSICSGTHADDGRLDSVLPRNSCALVKGIMGPLVGRPCPYVELADLVVGENTCDGKKKAYEQLAPALGKMHVIDLPQTRTAAGARLMKAEYLAYKARLEALTGNEITAEKLRGAIDLVNAKRQAQHRLARLRAADPAPITGLDALLINQISSNDDTARFTASVHRICDELEERVARGQGIGAPGAPRLLVSGCPMAPPNWKVPYLLEQAGALIVGEESCSGERAFRRLVDTSGETLDSLMDALVARYLQIDCAVFSPNGQRRAHIEKLAERLNIDGVVHYALKFCQPFEQEGLTLERELEQIGIPVLRIETDYSNQDTGQLSTRIEAFIELLRD